MSERVGVGLVIGNDRLRCFVRNYLETSGFRVDFAVRAPDPALPDADVAVTETSGVSGRLLTVRITEALAMPPGNPAIVLEPDELSTLPELIRFELLERSTVGRQKGEEAMAKREMQRPTMKVGDLGHADLAGVQSDATMADAAKMMRDLDVGSAVVFEGSKLIGIVTERDVMLAAIDCAELEGTPVAAFMTERPSTIWVDADVSQAALAMRALHARHLPVVDGTKVVGMISSRDLLEAMDTHAEVMSMRRRGWSTLWRRRPRIAEA